MSVLNVFLFQSYSIWVLHFWKYLNIWTWKIWNLENSKFQCLEKLWIVWELANNPGALHTMSNILRSLGNRWANLHTTASVICPVTAPFWNSLHVESTDNSVETPWKTRPQCVSFMVSLMSSIKIGFNWSGVTLSFQSGLTCRRHILNKVHASGVTSRRGVDAAG